MEKQKRVIDPKSYMHTFRLNEQQQVQFEKMMLTAGPRSQPGIIRIKKGDEGLRLNLMFDFR